MPIVALHGGPDFDHCYLLPELDQLSDSYRLIYYDQRGRGRSAPRARPEEVTIESEMGDLEALANHFQLNSFAVLGHSWGGVLAMQFAIRRPCRVSHLILMNTAPASYRDFLLLREDRRARHGEFDLIPSACAAHVAQAIPKARFVLLKQCGHFSYLECPGEVRKEIVGFLSGAGDEAAPE